MTYLDPKEVIHVTAVAQSQSHDPMREAAASANAVGRVADNEATLNDGYGIAIAEPRSKAEVDAAGNAAEGNRRGTVLDPRPKKRDSWWGR